MDGISKVQAKTVVYIVRGRQFQYKFIITFR